MRRRAWAPLALCLVLLGPGVCIAASRDAIKWHNFGAELLRQGKPDEAIAPLRQAVTLDPSFAQAHLSLATAYDRVGRADEAIAAYQQATALDPANATAFNNLAVLYAGKGLNDQAIQALELGLRADPGNATLQKNLANAREDRGILQERDTRIAAAWKEAEARPKDARAAYTLARVYAIFDQQDLAFEWLARALQLGFNDIRFVKEDPALLGLQEDPRFSRLLQDR